jgi:hypothetical protein
MKIQTKKIPLWFAAHFFAQNDLNAEKDLVRILGKSDLRLSTLNEQ